MVEHYLRSYVSYQQSDWYDLLPFAEAAYNNSLHRSTGYTPFRIVTGKDFPAIPELDIKTPEPKSTSEWTENIQRVWPHMKKALEKASIEYKYQADKKGADCPPLQPGDRVYLSTKYLQL